MEDDEQIDDVDVNVNDVPEAAVRWMLLHTVTSNVEVANFTQVNQNWRRIVKEVLLEQATQKQQQQQQQRRANDDDDESMTTASCCCLNNLLLPSMLRHMLREHHVAQNKNKTEDADVCSGRMSSSSSLDTFCAAWFPPEGIQEMTVSLGRSSTEEDDEEVLDDYNRSNNNSSSHAAPAPSTPSSGVVAPSEPFAPSGAQTYEGSNDDDDYRTNRSSRSRSRSPASFQQQSLSLRWRQQEEHPFLNSRQQQQQQQQAADNNVVICTKEWRGYRNPMDVLQHFGYTSSFVNDLFETAISIVSSSSSSTSCQAAVSDVSSSSSSCRNSSSIHHDDMPSSSITKKNGISSLSSPSLPNSNNNNESSTFAVRGSTIVRPESYCLCMDAAVARDKQQLLQTTTTTATAAATMTTNGSSSGTAQQQQQHHNNNWEDDIRFQEYRQSLIRRNKRRRQLQRDVLPRVLLRNNNDNNNKDDDYSRPPAAAGVQFLNADGSHAVCMTTPLFACGPLREPVTILCVAIATEDGCFLSGLHHRFELGHLYPRSGTLAEASELSPVCIATTSWKQDTVTTTLQQQNISLNPSNNSNHSSCPFKFSSSDDDSSYDPDDASSDFERCDCIFQGVCDKLNAVDDEDDNMDVNRLSIQRGRLGPGSWHCYVAIVDGKRSLIRIDGIEEPLQLDDRCNDRDGGAVVGDAAAHDHAAAMLDGLTIGSDHCFGMSLCCGCVSGGEGEGAIGELAVFKGRLDLMDIQVLERHLMSKHGIPFDTASSDMRWQEDKWTRHAEALLVQSDYCNEQDRRIGNHATEEDTRVPLRFLARHRSVAWRYTNAVTGKAALISKIGCRPGGGEESSDW